MQGGLRLHNSNKTSKTNEPLVSIITVVYNGVTHLEQTIKSVLNQTYKNIEYVIIDGGSKDGTVDVIKKYDTEIDYWISEPDSGIYFAMNKGISLAKGELIGIINADDFYCEDAVFTVVNELAYHPADIYHGDMRVLTDKTENVMKPDISKMNEMPSIFHPTCFVKKLVYDREGLFDTQYKISADYDFLLRCLKQNYLFYYIPKTLTNFRVGGMSGSCYSNVEGYRIMKKHQTGHHQKVIIRGIKCYVKTFLKKIINLGSNK